MKKKVLIVIGDVAAGHRSAAIAIEEAFSKIYKDEVDVKTIDLFIEADKAPFNSSDLTHVLVSRNRTAESIYNVINSIINTEVGCNIMSSIILNRMYKECCDIIRIEKPDIIISIHPITCAIINKYKAEHPELFTATVITDLISIPRLWASPNIDLTFAPTPDIVNLLVRYGVNIERIVFPLFPIKLSLQNFRPRETVLKELNLDPKIPTILITGGGLGIKTLFSAVKKILRTKKYQVIVICGRMDSINEELKRKYSANKSIAILGFVKNIQDYMVASDVIVAKPGPATILEIELLKKKCILTKRIGIQETGNVNFALRDPHFRYIGDDWSKLLPEIADLIECKIPSPRQEVRRRFNECEEIVKEIISRSES